MAIPRREALILGGVGVAAASAGALMGVVALQSRSGAAELLSARFHDLQGRPRRLIDWQGRALLCNFWATWCTPCREEIPILVAAKHKAAGIGLEIVGIGIDSADKIAEFAKIYKMTYSILVADATAITLLRSLGNRSGGLPYTVLLDAKGSVVRRHLGALTPADLEQFLKSPLR